MIAIVDYGMGNLRSVQNALTYLGVDHLVTSDPAQIASSSAIIVPGVGSFRQAMQNLNDTGLAAAIRTAAKEVPILGICLGMQLLADTGDEDGPSKGLGLIRGVVKRFHDPQVRVPHIGFNAVQSSTNSVLFNGIPHADFYFVHSYHFICDDASDIAGTATYGAPFVAAVERGTIFGTQFHPEKSQSNGLKVLKNFCEAFAC